MPAAILNFLEVRAVRLMSNNPDKIRALERGGVRVVERIPSIVDPVGASENYLRTKREKLGHLVDERGRLPGVRGRLALQFQGLRGLSRSPLLSLEAKEGTVWDQLACRKWS